VSVPRAAAHAGAGERFLEFLLGRDGKAILRRAYIDALDHPQIIGDSVPASLRASVAP
jgi:hypothetical protein